jgi:hypothetical protein
VDDVILWEYSWDSVYEELENIFYYKINTFIQEQKCDIIMHKYMNYFTEERLLKCKEKLIKMNLFSG